ncbi:MULTISPECIES: acetate--CoA ligase family protein [Rhodopseudomonas]|uniref:Acyl-CoA synthetase n=1 Tax=Rhodopseudomonas palustris TaxID=1076 RepID=A0A0D7EBU0_RHOPL|nr:MULTISPECIES: acetate--CoA ligase family protein [Rhodopseudomonas]KIZ38183.1 acyl-CoA synthetase [Rhodopseudomonas palustris]MDF3811874.1 acetate--CoA ligase family protein [Rhodopseudomonas sp. BAL398]WOK16640.1 acetate--CoA ligase family protein [Rhodopseudomonas sp. BAL398]
MSHPLDSFFAPSSIAIIGASRDPMKIPGLLLKFLRRNEFPGAIYPVNPNYPDIDGLACYPSVGAIGKPVDLAIIIIPARAVLGALAECAEAKIPNAVIISSGFGEEGGDGVAMQQAIADFARATGMRISGPNAEGFFNEPMKIAATFSPTVDVKPDVPRLLASRRRIGIVAQSGGIGFAIYNRARALGVALSIVISTGNESDLGAGECLDYMVQDAATDVILLFIEGIRDTEKFLVAARRAAQAGKPVIVTKVGRSDAGERAAASHTASMAGWNAAYDAVFAKYGCIVSNDLDEAVAIAAALTTSPLPKGDRVAVVTVSGGAGIWGADAVCAQGLRVPELSAPLQAQIRALIPSYGSARNPVDITAQAVHSGGLQKTIELLEACDEVDSILVVISLSSETRMPLKKAELKPLLDAQTKPVLFYSYTLPSDFAREGLAASGGVALSGLTHIAVALRQLVQRSRFSLAAEPEAFGMKSLDLSGYPVGGALSEYDSKRWLRDAGVALPDEILVAEKTVLEAAIARAGFPLVMKIQSPAIAHKSEVGGVRVNIASEAEALEAYDALLANAARHCPDAVIQGVLVGPMAKKGVEIIIGTMMDASFGPMIMVGLGGVVTELFKDVVWRPAPVGAAEAGAMLDGLKAAPLLHGFRGAPPADVGALAELIAQISQLAAHARDHVAEIELNPVLVHPLGDGVTIVDALVVGKTTNFLK